MEKEIYTSNSKDFCQSLNDISKKIFIQYGIPIQIVEIFGKRWSFIAGEKDEKSFLPPVCIKIYKNYGIVSNQWSKLDVSQKEDIIFLIKDFLEKYECK